MFVGKVEVGKDRNERLADIFLVWLSVVVHTVCERLVGSGGDSLLDSGVDIDCEIKSVIEESDARRIEICSLDADYGILCRIAQIGDVLVGIVHVTACIGGDCGG